MAGYSPVKKLRRTRKVWQGSLFATPSVDWQRLGLSAKGSFALDLHVCSLFREDPTVKSRALALRTHLAPTPSVLASDLREGS
jgi:hypothetical protein